MRIAWILTALLVMSSSLFAQPANQFLRLQGYPIHGYIEIPTDALLDTPQMTIEAWVNVIDAHSGTACSSIAGSGYTTGWWIGLCGTSMRSYFNGSASLKTGGVIPPGAWVHIAAVSDGTTRRHYINGELVFEGTETGALSASTRSIRIGSDADWDFMAAGAIDDLRIWKVARTQDQIRQTMFARFSPEFTDVTGEFESLEAWYRFEGNAFDSWHAHHGTIIGTGIGFEAGSVFTPLPNKRRAARH